jgi:hypothetical protein
VYLEVSLNGHEFSESLVPFSFVEEMQVVAIDPAFGGSAGGTVVTLYGKFNTDDESGEGVSCRFEGIADVKAEVISSTQLRCQVPPHPTLSVDEVRVSVSSNGLDYTSEYALFSYVREEKLFTVFPKEVSSKGGTKVEVFGTGFIPSLRLTCRFRQVGAVDQEEAAVEVAATMQSSPQKNIECIAPKFPPSMVQLQISNNGQIFSTDYVLLKFTEAMSVESIDPPSGSELGGTTVIVRGKYFSEESIQCRFGSILVPAIWLSWNEIRCLSPPHHPSMVGLSVTGNGRDFADSSVPFIFLSKQTPTDIHTKKDKDAHSAHNNLLEPMMMPAKTNQFVPFGSDVEGWSLVEVVPPLAGTAGGDTITFRGSHFTDSRHIVCAFGSVTVPGVYLSDSELRCLSPRHAPSEVVVEVSMDGYHWSFSKISFEFVLEHAVLAISPTHGPNEGSTIVTVYGSHFEDTALIRCRFGTVVVPILEFVSTSQVKCLSPFNRHGAGSVSVEVSQNNVTFSDNFILFRYDDYSSIAAINPSSGPSIGGTLVHVKGVNFVVDEALRCKFGDFVVPARYISSTELLCTSPLHRAGAYSLEVTLNGRDFLFSGIQFTYFDGPTVLHLWPSNGPALLGRTAVSVHGTGFVQTTDLHCRFNQMLSAATWLSNHQILCEAPPAMPGLVSFAVTNNREQWSLETVHFLYVHDATVAKVFPSHGFATGQFPVFVSGSNFVNTTSLACRFGRGEDRSMDNVVVRASYVSPSLLVCLAPAYDDEVEENQPTKPFFSPPRSSTVTVDVTNNGLDFTQSGMTLTYVSQGREGRKGVFRFGPSNLLLCPNGTMCETSLLGGVRTNFTMCWPGTFQPRIGQAQCLPCPIGFMCPDEGMAHPVICPAGFVCDEAGVRVPRKVCPKGQYCLPGTKSRDVLDFAWDTNTERDALTCRNQTQYLHNINRLPSNTEYDIIGDGVQRGGGVCTSLRDGRGGQWTEPRGGFGGEFSWSADYETEVLVFQPAVRSWAWINRTAPETGITKTEWAPDDDGVSHRCEHRRCEGRYLSRQRYVNHDNDGWFDPEFDPHPLDQGGTRDLIAEQPFPCPMGHYCRAGVAAPEPIPKNFSHPQKCFDGFFCPRGSHSPEGTGACPTGYFCPTQTEAYICPVGQYCSGIGNMKPKDCYPGTFNPIVGQSNCTVCTSGHVCPGACCTRTKNLSVTTVCPSHRDICVCV